MKNPLIAPMYMAEESNYQGPKDSIIYTTKEPLQEVQIEGKNVIGKILPIMFVSGYITLPPLVTFALVQGGWSITFGIGLSVLLLALTIPAEMIFYRKMNFLAHFHADPTEDFITIELRRLWTKNEVRNISREAITSFNRWEYRNDEGAQMIGFALVISGEKNVYLTSSISEIEAEQIAKGLGMGITATNPESTF